MKRGAERGLKHRSKQLCQGTVIGCQLLLATGSANGLLNQQDQQFQDKGIEVAMSLSPAGGKDILKAGENATIAFKIMDSRQKKTITKANPRAWISKQHSAMVANETPCADKIKMLTSGSLSARADINLNNYLLVTLNHDKTVSFINPQVAFSATKLENIVELPGLGADWVQTPVQHKIYITLPEQSLLAVVDVATRQLLTTVPMGSNSKPTRLLMQADGRYVWVGLDNSNEVFAVEVATNKVVARLSVESGLHNLAITRDNRFLAVSNSDANTVTLIDTQKHKVISSIKTGKTPVALAYGEASRLFYVAALNGGEISALDPESQKVVGIIPSDPGIVALHFEPQGRFAFALNQINSTVSVLDSATNKIIASANVVKDPDQILFTEQYAYVRGVGTEKFSLLNIENARQGMLQPMEIQAGQLAPEKAIDQVNFAPMMAMTPDGNSAIIANAPDRMLYYYQEGMMAPMGTFSNYMRMPRGLMLIDQSLKEAEPGIYSATVKIPASGEFDVPFLLEQPRIMHCFHASVSESANPDETVKQKSVQIKWHNESEPIVVNQPIDFRVSFLNQKELKPIPKLQEIEILVFRPPGLRQKHYRLTEVAEGVYKAKISFLDVGHYKIFFRIPALKLNWPDMASLDIDVKQE